MYGYNIKVPWMQCSVHVEHSETKKVVQNWQTAIHVPQDSIVIKRALKNQVVKIVFAFFSIGIFTERSLVQQ